MNNSNLTTSTDTSLVGTITISATSQEITLPKHSGEFGPGFILLGNTGTIGPQGPTCPVGPTGYMTSNILNDKDGALEKCIIDDTVEFIKRLPTSYIVSCDNCTKKYKLDENIIKQIVSIVDRVKSNMTLLETLIPEYKIARSQFAVKLNEAMNNTTCVYALLLLTYALASKDGDGNRKRLDRLYKIIMNHLNNKTRTETHADELLLLTPTLFSEFTHEQLLSFLALDRFWQLRIPKFYNTDHTHFVGEITHDWDNEAELFSKTSFYRLATIAKLSAEDLSIFVCRPDLNVAPLYECRIKRYVATRVACPMKWDLFNNDYVSQEQFDRISRI